MGIFEIAAILVTVTALFGFINYRFIKLPTTIGIMFVALSFSLVLVTLGMFGLGFVETAELLIERADFDEALLHGMLSFLLFAGSLHININDLAGEKWAVGLLASFGMLVSSALMGLAAWWLFGLFGLGVPVIYCLLFGALISPTDPVAVLGLAKSAGAPKSLETKIAGESLFNDGVAVVVFIVLLTLAKGGQDITVGHVAGLFVKEAIGGVVYGLGLGLLTFHMLKRVDNYQLEVIITLAAVMGGSVLAESLHISAPIAIVVTGLLIGNHGRALAMSETTRKNLDTFWELVDEILNAVLFVFIGLEVLVMDLDPEFLLAGVLLVPATLAARWLSVQAAIGPLRRFPDYLPGTARVLTWAGLRGGISVALALSLPHGPYRDVILVCTYVIVVFSIIVQGLTLRRVTERALGLHGPDGKGVA